MRKEIGGYFGLEDFAGQEYYPEAVAVNSGRNALLYIAKARGVQKLYIPYYLCDSVSGLCEREGIPFEYYHVDEHFRPVFDRTLGEHEWLYVVNYFGQVTDEESLKARYSRIIFDNVQAFFRKPVPGVDTVYSCRKFFGVPDGGYAVTEAKAGFPMEEDASMDRMRHILGRYESGNASVYYADFRKNDDLFDTLPLRRMSKLTHNLLRTVDYTAVRKKREENFAYLHEQLRYMNRLQLRLPEGPYSYPFYCENGMAVKKRLAEKGIYIATLWPNARECDDSSARDYANNILPLPCDQRYGIAEMDAIVELFRK